MKREDVERERPDEGSGAEQTPQGSDAVGQDGTIPDSREGVGIGAGAEPNTFEPEEDPDAVDGA
ncbi:MAG: hypothetical protein ABWX85_09455 [Arthrobacter sp.]